MDKKIKLYFSDLDERDDEEYGDIPPDGPVDLDELDRDLPPLKEELDDLQTFGFYIRETSSRSPNLKSQVLSLKGLNFGLIQSLKCVD